LTASAVAAASAIGAPEGAPAKKRGRKASVAESDRVSMSGTGDYDSPNLSLTPAEDKRRRNTAASARFRLKKKEREAAMERNLKNLENRVVELEREAEGLRKENGWLRGLLVGVNVPSSSLASNGSSLAHKTVTEKGAKEEIAVEA